MRHGVYVLPLAVALVMRFGLHSGQTPRWRTLAIRTVVTSLLLIVAVPGSTRTAAVVATAVGLIGSRALTVVAFALESRRL